MFSLYFFEESHLLCIIKRTKQLKLRLLPFIILFSNMKQTIITILFALFALTGQAQSDSETNGTPGWLWEISGNGLSQKSFLFGTCHGDGISFTDEEIYSIKGLAEAMDEAKAVFFEQNFGSKELSDEDKKEMKRQRDLINNPGPEYMMPEGAFYKLLYDSVAHFNEVNKFLTDKMRDVEYWKKSPSYWFIRMQMYAFTKARMCRSVDAAIYGEATKRGKEIGGLEEFSQVNDKLMQMYTNTTAIDTLSMKEQAEVIYTLIHLYDNDSIFQNRELHEVYLENDTCKLSQFFKEKASAISSFLWAMGSKGEEYRKSINEAENYQNEHLLRERNEAWIPVIKDNISTRTCLIAVGCRHLLSADGLIAMLRREGYTVEAVKKK